MLIAQRLKHLGQVVSREDILERNRIDGILEVISLGNAAERQMADCRNERGSALCVIYGSVGVHRADAQEHRDPDIVQRAVLNLGQVQMSDRLDGVGGARPIGDLAGDRINRFDHIQELADPFVAQLSAADVVDRHIRNHLSDSVVAQVEQVADLDIVEHFELLIQEVGQRDVRDRVHEALIEGSQHREQGLEGDIAQRLGRIVDQVADGQRSLGIGQEVDQLGSQFVEELARLDKVSQLDSLDLVDQSVLQEAVAQIHVAHDVAHDLGQRGDMVGDFAHRDILERRSLALLDFGQSHLADILSA